MKFSIKDFFSKCDQIRSFLRKSLTEIFSFCAVQVQEISWKHLNELQVSLEGYEITYVFHFIGSIFRM